MTRNPITPSERAEVVRQLEPPGLLWGSGLVRRYDDALLAAEAEAARLRDALEEIASPPDESKGEGYGCLDIHEARHIARVAMGGAA